MSKSEVSECGVCGAPSTHTVTLRVRGQRLEKDLCADHLKELLKGSRRRTRVVVRDDSGATALRLLPGRAQLGVPNVLARHQP